MTEELMLRGERERKEKVGELVVVQLKMICDVVVFCLLRVM